jgi:uncharacterized protein (DUF2147 family)
MDGEQRRCADHEGHRDVVNIRGMFWSLLLTAVLGPSPLLAQGFMGAWQRGDGIAKVKVAPCGNVICMTNTFIRPDVTDEKVGERLEFNVKGSRGQSLEGTVLDPKTGKSYSAVVTIAGDHMTTKGCVFGGAICKSTEWTRIR